MLFCNYQIRRRILLTGTPIQNSSQELWALMNFFLPTIFNLVKNSEEWFNEPFSDKCYVSLTNLEELLIIRRIYQVDLLVFNVYPLIIVTFVSVN